MRMFNQNKIQVAVKNAMLGAVIALGFVSCTTDPNSPGLEYMPDMYRPNPYEAYLEKHDVDSADFFERNIERLAPDFESLSPAEKNEVEAEVASLYAVFVNGGTSRKPVSGTVAQGKKPYTLAEDEKEKSKSLASPFSYTKGIVKEGKAYYEIFCDHCHGEKGDGNGPMVSKGVYPAQPPSYAGAAKDLTAGEIYHTIYYGKGVMGSHAAQISEDKRWKIVMYVQTLQGKKLEDLASAKVTAPAVVEDSTVVVPVDTAQAK